MDIEKTTREVLNRTTLPDGWKWLMSDDSCLQKSYRANEYQFCARAENSPEHVIGRITEHITLYSEELYIDAVDAEAKSVVRKILFNRPDNDEAAS